MYFFKDYTNFLSPPTLPRGKIFYFKVTKNLTFYLRNCGFWLKYTLVMLKNRQSALFLVKANTTFVGEHLYTHRVFNLTVSLHNSHTSLLFLVTGKKQRILKTEKCMSYLPHSVTCRRISEICILSSTQRTPITLSEKSKTRSRQVYNRIFSECL